MNVLRDEWARFRKGWGNGERPLIIAILIFLASVAVLAAVIVAANVFGPTTFAPLENIVPQRVLNTGLIHPGDPVSILAVKCNHASQDVAVEGRVYFRNIRTGDLVLFRSGEASRPPGCHTYHFENIVPLTLPPGRYQIEGVEITRQGTDVQQEPYRTEPFDVTARGE